MTQARHPTGCQRQGFRGKQPLLPAVPDQPGGDLEPANSGNPAMLFPSTAMRDAIDK